MIFGQNEADYRGKFSLSMAKCNPPLWVLIAIELLSLFCKLDPPSCINISKIFPPFWLGIIENKNSPFPNILQVEAGWLDIIQRIYHHNSWATQETYQNLVLWAPGHNPAYETATTMFTPPSKDTLSPTHRNLLCPLDSKAGFTVCSNINVYFPFVSVGITTLNTPLLIPYNLVPIPLYTAASWNETQWLNLTDPCPALGDCFDGL